PVLLVDCAARKHSLAAATITHGAQSRPLRVGPLARERPSGRRFEASEAAPNATPGSQIVTADDTRECEDDSVVPAALSTEPGGLSTELGPHRAGEFAYLVDSQGERHRDVRGQKDHAADDQLGDAGELARTPYRRHRGHDAEGWNRRDAGRDGQPPKCGEDPPEPERSEPAAQEQ